MSTIVKVKETRIHVHEIEINGKISECAADLIAGRLSRRIDTNDSNDIADIFAESNIEVLEVYNDYCGIGKYEWVGFLEEQK